jgi:hypothetical protein
MKAAETRFWLLTALNAVAVVTILCVILDRFPATRLPIIDYGALMGSLLISVLIPLGVALVLLLRLAGGGFSAGRRLYALASYVFLTVAWLVTLTPAVVVIGLWQPWPLSLKQGPDTQTARAGFENVLGFAAPATVSAVYYRKVAIMGEATHHIRFTFDDTAVVEEIVGRFDLLRVPPEDRSRALVGFVRVHSAPASWWPAERVNGADTVYVDRHTWAFARGDPQGTRFIPVSRILWLDEAARTVFYREMRE